jgi:hypothetical protein
MGISGTEQERFSTGRSGDRRLEKSERGAMRRWWPGQALVFMSLLKDTGAAGKRSGERVAGGSSGWHSHGVAL